MLQGRRMSSVSDANGPCVRLGERRERKLDEWRELQPHVTLTLIFPKRTHRGRLCGTDPPRFEQPSLQRGQVRRTGQTRRRYAVLVARPGAHRGARLGRGHRGVDAPPHLRAVPPRGPCRRPWARPRPLHRGRADPPSRGKPGCALGARKGLDVHLPPAVGALSIGMEQRITSSATGQLAVELGMAAPRAYANVVASLDGVVWIWG